jgi:D-alanyl-D-alanine carboxypeptidase
MKITKRLLKILLPIITILFTAVFIPWDNVLTWAAPLPDTIQEQVARAVGYRLDGIIVYIDKKGAKPEFYSSGLKNRESKIPSNPHALFKIASISKLYIAVAAAKLVNKKKLLLDKTLTYYLPELAGRMDHVEHISMRMLLQHRSGIPDFIDDPKLSWSDLPVNANDYLQLVLDKQAQFKPDNRYRYCNTNYLLIGKVLDKILGYDHQQYIKKEILDTLMLTNTYGSLSQVDLKDVVSGYFKGYDGDLKAQNYVVAGGSMVATAQDVGIFLRALNDGTLLNKKEQSIYSNIYVYEHTGLLPGYSSIARYYKDIDTIVVMLVNTSGGNTWGILEIVFDRIVKILRKQIKNNKKSNLSNSG